MKDGAVLANAGPLRRRDRPRRPARARPATVREVLPLVEQYDLGDGRRLNLLAAGASSTSPRREGHPAAVMDMSFALQALAVEHLVARRRAGARRAPGARRDRPRGRAR